MKKILYAAAIALLFVGCSLEETPKSKFDESEAYKSSTLVYVNTVASLYTKMFNRFHGAGDVHLGNVAHIAAGFEDQARQRPREGAKRRQLFA